MRREEYERTYGRRGVIPPAPVHEYRRPRSRKKMRCLISLGLILPTLAAVIGVAAWAVSADVAVNDGNRVKVDGSPHLQGNIPLIQDRIDGGFNPRYDEGRSARHNQPNNIREPPPYPPETNGVNRAREAKPSTVEVRTSTETSGVHSVRPPPAKPAASNPSSGTNVGDLLSQIISASRGTSNGNPQFVVVAPLLDTKERDELTGQRTSGGSSEEGERGNDSRSNKRKKNPGGPERIDHSEGPRPPGSSGQKGHFSDRIGHSSEIQIPSESNSQEFLLPPLQAESLDPQPEISHIPQEEPIFIDLTSSSKNVHHSFSAPSVPSFGISQPVGPLPALLPPAPPPSPPKPPPSSFHVPPYQNANRQTFYPKPGPPSHHGPKPYAPVRQSGGGGSFGPPLPPPPQPPSNSFFSELVSSGSSGSNKNEGQQGSNRWGTVSHHGGYGHLEPPKGITFSISGSPHSYHSDYHSHPGPLSVVKSIFLPFLPKPRVNLNGRVVFGVVLEKGLGLGGNKATPHHEPPY